MSEEKIIEDPEDRPVMRSPLREALHRARQQEAERDDVIVELREAEVARLELLQDALSDVFEDIPPDTDLLECTLSAGTPPRLWIDVLGHVVMGRDKRTYRFLKDTRHGRQVMLETTSVEEMASRVTDYVAHRLIERERALESDRDAAPSTPERLAETQIESRPSATSGGVGGWSLLLVFLLGIVVGVAGLFSAGMVLISR
ncbi:hypothetical protein [Microbaculum marinum]|uniref:Uncharacterized protein n=1 Tax=Microbaculum marinum TaxID=1764581 RepID=A0AAW9RJ45_9HYPH